MRTNVAVLYNVVLLFVKRCNAQERPAYDIPNWTPNVSHRNNFCEQHAALERGEIELRNALKGFSLSVGFLRYQLNQETGAIDAENPDIAVEMMDELARRAGFTYRRSFGVLDPPGENKTWSDLLEYATDVYDITGEWYTETTDRLQRNILYPEGWVDANYIMVMETDEDLGFALTAFTTPFTPGVWGLIAITTIITGLVYYFLDFFDSWIKKRPMDFGLERSLFMTAFLFKGHVAHDPKSRSTRILVFSISFFYLLIVACYTANLASFLVLQNRQVVVNDVQDAIKQDLTFCVEDGMPYMDFLNTFRLQPRNFFRTQTEGEAESSSYFALQEGKCDIVFTNRGTFERFRRSQVHNPDCDLEFIGRIQKFLSGGFALKDSEQSCSSLLRDVFHLHMLEMKDSGIYDMIWEDFLSKAATNTCADTRATSNAENGGYDSLGVTNLSGIFLLHGIAVMVALGIKVLQFCKQPWLRKKAMIREVQKGILGTTSLNRAVKVVTTNPSTPCLPLQVQTQLDSSSRTEETAEDETSGCDQRKAAENGVKLNIAKEIEENRNELITEQRMLIETLLQQIQKMEEKIEKLS